MNQSLFQGAIRRNLKDSLTIGRHEDAAEFVGYVLGLEPQMRIQVITTRTCLTCRKVISNFLD